MTIIVHAGAHKTGTTSLQKLMKKNVRRLRWQGIAYFSRNYHTFDDLEAYRENFLQPIRQLMIDDNLSSSERRTLMQQIKKVAELRRGKLPDLLISDEALAGRLAWREASLYVNVRKRMQILTEAFAPEKIQVIFYVREQASYLESAYVQRIQRGIDLQWEDFISKVDLEALYWSTVISDIADVVGSENVAVRTFETIKAGFVPFATDFFSIFANPAWLKMESIAANESLSEKGVRLARAMSPELTEADWRKCRPFLQENFNSKLYPAARFFPEVTRDEIRERYTNDTAVVIENYGSTIFRDATAFESLKRWFFR